ncbi:MAG: tetraacyldisaccharide 4'-kinase [Flavobacteriales bacterium]|nr:tetraacyldisaccharide 4'-kinase [Flavobacteriales bacterium]MCX7767885.1 tetraacyldisaccharide 4'-kinase [Flavobacteriales bacterium]
MKIKYLAGLVLGPISLLYGIVVWTRNKFFDAGLLKIYEPLYPVISVGNITTGGTGKTPFCMMLAKFFLDRGIPVVYISRGYGRQSRGLRRVDPTTTARISGDEPLMVSRRVPGLLVLVSAQRAKALEKAKATLERPFLSIMDDAFQHRRVKPILNIVLLAERDLEPPRLLLPAGRLREPLKSLQRAHALIVTKEMTGRYTEKLFREFPEKPIFKGNVCIEGFFKYSDSVFHKEIPYRKFYVFCGIGYPEHFLNDLKNFGTVIGKRIFADHHWYSETDVREILTEFDLLSIENKILVTTEKDLVRLEELSEFPVLLGRRPLFIARSSFIFKDKNERHRFFEFISSSTGLKTLLGTTPKND